jgi:hypothetical protein
MRRLILASVLIAAPAIAQPPPNPDIRGEMGTVTIF